MKTSQIGRIATGWMITMPVSLPRRGRGGPAGCRGGHDGGQGRGGWGDLLPSRKRNAMLMSSSRNTTLAVPTLGDSGFGYGFQPNSILLSALHSTP